VFAATAAFAQTPMPAKTHVKGYTKTTKTGKVVHVKGYNRTAKTPLPKTTHVSGYTKTTKTGKMVHVKGYTRKSSAMPKGMMKSPMTPGINPGAKR
jgi:uncharacterized protein (DUF2344 family)